MRLMEGLPEMRPSIVASRASCAVSSCMQCLAKEVSPHDQPASQSGRLLMCGQVTGVCDALK